MLKRHDALKPFSREHFHGLFHAHQLMWLKIGRARENPATTVANFQKTWEELLLHHFDEEERLFKSMPVSAESLTRLADEHKELRALAERLFAPGESVDLSLCTAVGEALEKHIRWEERSFYPEVEACLSADELEALGMETKILDERRKSCGL
jgi:hemerythrin-like domain-containing protein